MTHERTADRNFLIAHGGWFFDRQRKLRLIREDDFNPVGRAIFFVTIAWGVPFLISAASGTAFGPLSARPYLLDPGVWARSFLAVGLLVLAEAQIEKRLHDVVIQFFDGALLSLKSITPANAAIERALKHRDNSLPEVMCLILALSASLFLILTMRDQASASWATEMTAAGRSFTPAAWWAILVSNTLFWFLLARAIWQHIVWGLLLRDFSRLETRLVASHPDSHGGLAFVGRYPNAYVLFTVAVSGVLSAAVTNQVLHGVFTAAGLGTIMGLWLCAIFAYFGLPLIGFVRMLFGLKRQTLFVAAIRATEYQRQAERNILGKNIVAPESKPAKAPEMSDPGKLYETAKKLSPLLVTRSTLVPVSAAALIPFAAVGMTQLPIKQLVAILKHLLVF